MLMPCDLASLDPELYEQLMMGRQERQPASTTNTMGKWSRSGPGPVAFIGGTWTSGVTLAPEYLVENDSQIVSLHYAWSNEKLRKWEPRSNVRLLLTDCENMTTWMTDVTAATSGGIILPARVKLSANCQVIFQLKADERQGPLHIPPYIPAHAVTIRYRQ